MRDKNDTLAQMLETGAFSDLSIVCQGREFRVHKAVVSIHSPVFSDLLNSKDSKRFTYTITEFEIPAVQRMVEFMYHDDYTTTVPKKRADSTDTDALVLCKESERQADPQPSAKDEPNNSGDWSDVSLVDSPKASDAVLNASDVAPQTASDTTPNAPETASKSAPDAVPKANDTQSNKEPGASPTETPKAVALAGPEDEVASLQDHVMVNSIADRFGIKKLVTLANQKIENYISTQGAQKNSINVVSELAGAISLATKSTRDTVILDIFARATASNLSNISLSLDSLIPNTLSPFAWRLFCECRNGAFEVDRLSKEVASLKLSLKQAEKRALQSNPAPKNASFFLDSSASGNNLFAQSTAPAIKPGGFFHAQSTVPTIKSNPFGFGMPSTSDTAPLSAYAATQLPTSNADKAPTSTASLGIFPAPSWNSGK